jgi:Domain of unknown function (DUF5122) beta-propeller
MRNTAIRLAVVACLAVAVGMGARPALGSIAQPSVVSDNPANYTPNVIDDGVVNPTSVDALAQIGDTLYAGGAFHLVKNADQTVSYTRNNLMGFSATSGAMSAFAPDFNGKVFALAVSGNSLYVGGYFTTVNGVSRRGLAKIDATTGTVDTAFNANLNGDVQEIRMANGRLFVGGNFTKRLVALDPATGADTGYVNISIAGSVASNAGKTDIYRFAVNPAANRLVAIGNFTTVGGQARSRAFMLDLGTTAASLDSWYYQPLTKMCAANSLPAYLRDVDFSPDGSYFVIDATGYIPTTTAGIGTDLCDAAARFETSIASPTTPTWINYSGGDTFHSISATGAAVYVQGHFRWLDNPFGNNSAGPGAVSRPGIGAIDPVTGKALSWNPGKSRGVGGKDLLATPAGLWVGSDGARFAGEYRDNLAFLPL